MSSTRSRAFETVLVRLGWASIGALLALAAVFLSAVVVYWEEYGTAEMSVGIAAHVVIPAMALGALLGAVLGPLAYRGIRAVAEWLWDWLVW